MGDNQAYTYMEANVIAAYNAGLRGEQLAPFLAPYDGTDIDQGGRLDLETEDGLNIDGVILSQLDPGKHADLMTRRPEDEESDAFEQWKDEYFDAVNAVTGRFGW